MKYARVHLRDLISDEKKTINKNMINLRKRDWKKSFEVKIFTGNETTVCVE